MQTHSSLPHLPGWRITERDLAIVGEVLRWQQLTTNQIARWFFASPRTASNRIAVLLELGYLKTIDIPWRAPALVTTTAKGARARADLGLRPGASEPGRLLHDLTVVQVAQLTAVLGSSVLYGASFPPHALRGVAWCALVPFFVVLRGLTLRRGV